MEVRQKLEQAWVNCGEYLPSEDVLEIFKKHSSSLTELDVSGLECVTDEFFHALLTAQAGTSIVRAVCSACVHVTDFGISFLAQACPKLSEVVLDGCRKVTAASLHTLAQCCPLLSVVSVRATGVTHIPHSVPPNLPVALDGCPLLYGPNETPRPGTDDALSTSYKLLLLTDDKVKYSVLDFLQTGELSEPEKGSADIRYSAKTQLKKIDAFNFNIYEFHVKRGMYAPFLSERTAFVFTMKLDTATSPWMDTLSLMSEIHGQVLNYSMHVLCLHEGRADDVKQVEKLAEDIRLCRTRQRSILESHYHKEGYDHQQKSRPQERGDRDFLSQVRFSRSLMFDKNVSSLKIYAVNINKEREIELVYPKFSHSSDIGGEEKSEQEKDIDSKDLLDFIPQFEKGMSVEELNAAREGIQAEAEELYEEFLPMLERVSGGLDSLSKAEITEVKSFSSPPPAVLKTLGVMVRLMGEKNDDWATIKRFLSRPARILELRQFDKDNISPKCAKILEQYVADPLNVPQTNMRVSRMSGIICDWLHSIHTYTMRLGKPMQVLKARMQHIDEKIIQINERKGLVGKGPGIILAMLSQDVSKLHDKICPHLRIPQNSLITQVQEALQASRDQKGEVLYFTGVAGRPVVTDIECFLQLLHMLHSLPEREDLYNNDRVSCLGDVVPIFTSQDILSAMTQQNLSLQQVDLYISILTDQGILVEIPGKQLNDVPAGSKYFYCYTNLYERRQEIYMREGPNAGTYSTSRFMEVFWTADRSKYMWLDYYYAFAGGMPLSLMARIQAECLQIGVVLKMWKWGVIVRLASAEISIKINVNMSLQIKGIDVCLRTSKHDGGQPRVQLEHAWSIMSQYLLVVDQLVHLNPYIPVRGTQPCRGHWCETEGQNPYKFSSSEVPRRLHQTLPCVKCMDNSMTKEQADMLTGRQRFMARHNFVNSSDPRNTLPNPDVAYSRSNQCPDSSEPQWRCFVCNISVSAAIKLWEKEYALYPAFVSSSLHLTGAETEDGASAILPRGNILTLRDNLPGGSQGIATFTHPLLITGFLGFSMTVTAVGKISVVIGGVQLGGSYTTMDDIEKPIYIFKLDTGLLLARDKATRVLSEQVYEPIQQYDTFSCEIELECDVDESRIVFKKNGVTFNSQPLIKAYVALVLENDGENKPEFILNAPSVPVVRTHHFPLGSALLYKSSRKQQWMLGEVMATTRGRVVVGDSSQEEPVEESYETWSDNMLPLTCHMDNITVLVNKGGNMVMARDSQDYLPWLQSRQRWPAPSGIFQQFHSYLGSFAKFSNNQTNVSTKNFNRLRLGKLEFDSWRCMASRHSPEVLYARSRNVRGHTITKKWKSWAGYVMLPRFGNDARLLYNPQVSVAHDMKSQTLHPVCVGTKIAGLGELEYINDCHFMGAPPYELGEQQAESALDVYSTELRHTYLSMSLLGDVFLPYDKHFNDDVMKVKRCIQHYIDIYFSTLALWSWYTFLSDRDYGKIDSSTLLQNILGAEEQVAKTTGKSRRAGKPKQHVCACHISDHAYGEECKQTSLVPFRRRLTLKNMRVNGVKPEVLHAGLRAHSNLLVLDLAGCGLYQLPGLDNCPHLTHIDVSRNYLTQVPPEVAHLSATLRCLDVSDNAITELPEFITNLTKLVKLSATHLRSLPHNIGDLRYLHTLYIKRFMCSSLPDSFSKLEYLEDLVLEGVAFNKSDKVHSKTNWMGQYSKNHGHHTFGMSEKEWEQVFDDFHVSGDGLISDEMLPKFTKKVNDLFPRLGDLKKPNKEEGAEKEGEEEDQLGGFPPQILDCRRLRFLLIRHQSFRLIPAAISQLSRLTILNVSNNVQLEALDAELGKLTKLKDLAVRWVPNLRTPPPEIVRQGSNTLIAYLRRLSQGSVSCYRTKLMFVGLGGAGKTSLMRALMSVDGRNAVTEAEGITDGIDITAWTLPYQNQTYTFSVWDFAGQTVYYNTHQFFLSNRAVYMLVWNTRLGYEHSGLEFWLSSISCHTPRAPIFVIGTHADQISNSDLPQQKLKKIFPNIVGFLFVSSVTGKGVEDLRMQFLKVASEQPYMGERVPEAWLSLERLILSERSAQKKILTWTELKTLAEKAAITGKELRRAVLFLHELGALQYFDNELLNDRVVINPQWIVDVMACVVSVHNTPIKGGHLRHRDVAKVWSKYPKNLHAWLLHLTEVFDLTFPLPDTQENIVPCLLRQDEPEYKWPEIKDDVIEMRMFYHFDYLPAGLFNRAQVRLYEFSESTTMWKEGSILKKNDNTGLIKQTKDNEVMVKVAGVRPENILLLVHEVIEGLIAEFFQGVKYEYRLPCMDCIRSDAKDPAMFSSRVMNRAIQMKALFLQCHAYFHTLSITEMQSVMPPASNTDYALQLENAIEKLDELHGQLASQVFFLSCPQDVPDNILSETVLHPARLKTDLEAAGFKCHYEENIFKKPVSELMTAMRKSKMCVVFVSDKFVADVACQRAFFFLLNNLKTEFVLVMVGGSRDWLKSDIGGKVAERVFINFQRMPQYGEKVKELIEKLQLKLFTQKDTNESCQPDVFLSYCWSNSLRSVNQRIARMKEGALGAGDPRDIKDFLESKGYKVWLDLEQTGKAGLFEDIAAGMRKAKVVVACVSDEYVLSENCQMEFRFAHIALHKPIIAVIVGTGFLWESTEIGMLSLGYPKVCFKVANNLAHKMLLEYVRERVETEQVQDGPERPISVASNSHKETAFQELYELAQRKFLRQISSYTELSDPYPRLFVADLSFNPDDNDGDGADVDVSDLDVELCEEAPGPKSRMVLEDMDSGLFCIKTLCEYEGGWHAVTTEGLDLPYDIEKDETKAGFEGRYPILELGGEQLKSVWHMVSPYMARVLAILKHSPVNLHIIQHPQGHRLQKLLEQSTRVQPQSNLEPIYKAIRAFVIRKDTGKKRGGLARCHLPSGKVLWLCAEHQKGSRVTVLDDDEDEVDDLEDDPSAEGTAEEMLISALSKILPANTQGATPDTGPSSTGPRVGQKTRKPRDTASTTETLAKEQTAAVKEVVKEVKAASPVRPVSPAVTLLSPTGSGTRWRSERSGKVDTATTRKYTREEKANIAATVAAGSSGNTSQACLIL